MGKIHFFKANISVWPTTANTLILKDSKGLIVFDPGSGLQTNLKILTDKLKKAHLDIKDTHTIVITHSHPDHFGSIDHFCKISKFDRVSLYIQPEELKAASDAEMQNGMYGMEIIPKYFDLTDANNNRVFKNINRFLERFCPPTTIPSKVEITTLKDKDTITFEEWEFRVISTPGHSPGHLVFYEVNQQLLLSGDLIGGETAIWYSPFSGGAIEYIKSLQKLEMLSVETVFPSHGESFSNMRDRLNSIKANILQKDEEILQLLQLKSRTFSDLAKQMFGDQNYRFFPGTIILQSHLEKLITENRIKRDDNRFFASKHLPKTKPDTLPQPINN